VLFLSYRNGMKDSIRTEEVSAEMITKGQKWKNTKRTKPVNALPAAWPTGAHVRMYVKWLLLDIMTLHHSSTNNQDTIRVSTPTVTEQLLLLDVLHFNLPWILWVRLTHA